MDKNPYKSAVISETYRSVKCVQLVNPRRWKCVECNKVVSVLKRKHELAEKEHVHPMTPNVFLTAEQRMEKLDKLSTKIESARRQVQRLEDKVEGLLKTEGVNVDKDLSALLSEGVESQNLSPRAAHYFCQQQVMASKAERA